MDKHWILCLTILPFLGCGSSNQGARQKPTGATVDTVCNAAAELMNVKRSKVTGATTLAELGADDLDFVELVMELEEIYEVSIPDEAIYVDSENEPTAFQKLTMQQLANIVDQQKKPVAPMP